MSRLSLGKSLSETKDTILAIEGRSSETMIFDAISSQRIAICRISGSFPALLLFAAEDRLRKSRSRYYSPWTPHQKVDTFESWENNPRSRVTITRIYIRRRCQRSDVPLQSINLYPSNNSLTWRSLRVTATKIPLQTWCRNNIQSSTVKPSVTVYSERNSSIDFS